MIYIGYRAYIQYIDIYTIYRCTYIGYPYRIQDEYIGYRTWGRESIRVLEPVAW